MDSSRLHTIVLNGGDGADGLALVHIQQEDDDDRAADGEESEVGGCPCDGAGHAAANEVRDDEDKDDDNGHDDERTEHGGAAPATGVKYAINCWIRARSPDRASWMPKGEEGLFGRLAGGLMGA